MSKNNSMVKIYIHFFFQFIYTIIWVEHKKRGKPNCFITIIPRRLQAVVEVKQTIPVQLENLTGISK